MLIADVLRPINATHPLSAIHEGCSQFISMAGSSPLYRNLPSSYGDIQRVKVRTKKRPTNIGEVFNQAFESRYANLAQRAVFATPAPTLPQANTEPFYILPINGFEFIYSTEISESSNEYNDVLAILIEQLHDEKSATDIVADLLKLTYTSRSLREGMEAGSEIILYGIPYYYAVRCSTYPDYDKIIATI